MTAHIQGAVALPPPAQATTPAPTLAAPILAQQERPAVQAAEDEHVPPERRVNAKTTFQDLLDWGVSSEAITQITGVKLPAPAMVVKDYVVSQGMEFSSVKAALQAEVDKIVH